MHGVRLDGFRLHVKIPDFDGQIVSGDHVATRVGEFHVGYTGDDFREERSVGWILRLLEHFSVAITEGRLEGNYVDNLSRLSSIQILPVSCHRV